MNKMKRFLKALKFVVEIIMVIGTLTLPWIIFIPAPYSYIGATLLLLTLGTYVVYKHG